jgi:hypothetical protein
MVVAVSVSVSVFGTLSLEVGYSSLPVVLVLFMRTKVLVKVLIPVRRWQSFMGKDQTII